MQPKLAAEFIEIGRQLSASKQIVMEKYIEDAKSKSENLVNAQREAATLFFNYVQHCTEYSPSTRQQAHGNTSGSTNGLETQRIGRS